MKKFIINFNNGYTSNVTVQNVDEAKKIAEEQMSYTQEDVSICTDGNQEELLAISRWYGYEATEEERENNIVLMEFGSSGFYSVWEEEF